ncbi:hypothetical protein HID58_020663 [Brassica napus]|uniref:BnaA06g00990D protein n=2 Tax=Brassica napus TaxID=3708 RepID=A0A078GFF6_BRANA|nr:protein GRAVITROPIC IN THE LIGHT 1 [Brassica napus]XP_022576214.1 protein GRAVITROPIC IN THE LIGHT 1 [Brassica napus]XP_048637711.1 protein GRAVITROPIC IN THE LIGHT 1 [Brassica napus]KAH0920645.1 hypothetical protein HID58_020663 [Brassica napus]CAF2081000.1 unnamed protein product [Brassica napus]CDY24101.1 BnaA06g00990D [Brassica napus]
METVRPVIVAPKGKFRRTFAKVLNIHKLTGVAPEEEMKKTNNVKLSESFYKLEEEYERTLTLEALLAKLFATVSSIKAGYAQLQHSQSPYDAIGIQKADNLVVSELKTLSELKQCFLKKQIDPNPERTLVLAEIQELRSLLKTYEIMGKKLESQYKLKDSETLFLREKLEDLTKQNKLTEKRLDQSGQLCNPLENLHLSALNPTHFVAYLQHTVKSTRGFVRLMIEQMKLAKWDISMAVNSIQPGVFYYKQDHKCFAFEHFVSNVMFEAFHLPYFSTARSFKKMEKQSKTEEKQSRTEEREVFFERFTELKSMKAKDYLKARPKSRFARFCRIKFLQLIHPKMEEALFGHLHLRNQVSAGEFPETSLCSGFLEMAKRVWLLHCLAFSFEREAEIFRVPKGCRFSEVYMRSVAEEGLEEAEPRVAFTVVPGFKIGKTSIQCEVYLSDGGGPQG